MQSVHFRVGIHKGRERFGTKVFFRFCLYRDNFAVVLNQKINYYINPTEYGKRCVNF